MSEFSLSPLVRRLYMDGFLADSVAFQEHREDDEDFSEDSSEEDPSEENPSDAAQPQQLPQTLKRKLRGMPPPPRKEVRKS